MKNGTGKKTDSGRGGRILLLGRIPSYPRERGKGLEKKRERERERERN
jgi:hypothetical protein